MNKIVQYIRLDVHKESVASSSLRRMPLWVGNNLTSLPRR